MQTTIDLQFKNNTAGVPDVEAASDKRRSASAFKDQDYSNRGLDCVQFAISWAPERFGLLEALQ